MLDGFASKYPKMDIESVEIFLTYIKLAKQIEKKLESYFTKDKISSAKFIILMIIEREPQRDLNATDIANKISISKKNLSRLIKSMKEASLITITENPNDLRSSYIKQTLKGKKLLKKLLPGYFDIINETLEPLRKKDKKVFSKLLNTISSNT